jgi:hypothetical protein
MSVEQLAKNREADCVAKFKPIQAGYRQGFIPARDDMGSRNGRMSLLDVEAVEKARVGVDAQYLPLFSARSARAADAEIVERP